VVVQVSLDVIIATQGMHHKHTAFIGDLLGNQAAMLEHLEAKHNSTIIAPVPPKWDDVRQIIDATRAAIVAREKFEQSFLSLMAETKILLATLIGNIANKKKL